MSSKIQTYITKYKTVWLIHFRLIDLSKESNLQVINCRACPYRHHIVLSSSSQLSWTLNFKSCIFPVLNCSRRWHQRVVAIGSQVVAHLYDWTGSFLFWTLFCKLDRSVTEKRMRFFSSRRSVYCRNLLNIPVCVCVCACVRVCVCACDAIVINIIKR